MAESTTPPVGLAFGRTAWADGRSRVFLPGAGWTTYLVLMALLIPTLKPMLGGEVAFVDGLNTVAIVVFFAQMLASGMRIEFPLLLPAFFVGVGSMIATVNAESFGKSALTLVQDAYLYIWFVMLVNVLKQRPARHDLQIAWVWAGNIAALIGLYLLLSDGGTEFMKIFGAKGQRAVGLFDGPNSLADFLMMSAFVTLSLSGQVRSVFLWGSMGCQLLGLIATKSNGGMLGLLLGLGLWMIIRTATKTRSVMTVIALVMILGGVTLAGLWVGLEFGGVGVDNMQAIQQKTSAGRFEQSAEGRERIWSRLLGTYAKRPVGIGPGNSSEQRLSVSQLERKRSTKGKEAHNDYIGYLVERGPLGLIGLLILTFQPFVLLRKGYQRNDDLAWRAAAGGAIAAALAGGLVATTIHSLFMEKLHFRHYWAFLALVYAYGAAVYPLARPAAAAEPVQSLGNGGRR